MTFMEADALLAGIANGAYRSLRFEMTTYADGEVRTDCTVYIDGSRWISGHTWAETFRKLSEADEVEQPPEVEA